VEGLGAVAVEPLQWIVYEFPDGLLPVGHGGPVLRSMRLAVGVVAAIIVLIVAQLLEVFHQGHVGGIIIGQAAFFDAVPADEQLGVSGPY